MQEANWSERKKDVRGRHSANISIVSGRPSRILLLSLSRWMSDSFARRVRRVNTRARIIDTRLLARRVRRD